MASPTSPLCLARSAASRAFTPSPIGRSALGPILALTAVFLAGDRHAIAAAASGKREFEVPARCREVETRLSVREGVEYRVEVIAMCGVKDWILPIRNLEGWPKWAEALYLPLFWTKRHRAEPWFALMATVDGRCPRRLREGVAYRAPRSGRLVCYFNDAPFAYGNNKGTARLRLSVLRQSPYHR